MNVVVSDTLLSKSKVAPRFKLYSKRASNKQAIQQTQNKLKHTSVIRLRNGFWSRVSHNSICKKNLCDCVYGIVKSQIGHFQFEKLERSQDPNEMVFKRRDPKMV